MLANPLFRDLKSFLLYAVVWLFFTGLYFSLTYIGLSIPLLTAATDSLIFNLILAALGLGFWYPAKFIKFDEGKFIQFLFTHLTAAAFAVLIWLTAGFLATNMVLGDPEIYNNFFFSTLAWRILTGILFYFLITTVYYTFIYYSEYQERTVREAGLKSLITEAELKSLKFQINPHFIFNSLNSISSLTIADPAGARTMILKLADFLRYTVSNDNRQMSTLDDELKNVKLYLDIEKIRFEEKFEYIETTEEACRKILLPNMIMQPLIENAVKHSVHDALEKVIIKVNCSIENDFLKLEITNTLEKDSLKKGTGVGLKNISERLMLIYNRSDLLKIDKGEGEYRVRLYIPLSMQDK
jgi:two-component system, LytTR family, sensor kinase